MDAQTIAIAWTASNVIALGFFLLSRRTPNLTRLLFVILFAWASQVNFRLAFRHPAEYLDYADFTFLETYRRLILGPFAQHITEYVSAIAAGQLAIAILLLFRKPYSRLGLAGAIAFFVAIAPFGIGSAFPCTLVLALAAWRVGHWGDARSLPVALRSGWRRLLRNRAQRHAHT